MQLDLVQVDINEKAPSESFGRSFPLKPWCLQGGPR